MERVITQLIKKRLEIKANEITKDEDKFNID